MLWNMWPAEFPDKALLIHSSYTLAKSILFIPLMTGKLRIDWCRQHFFCRQIFNDVCLEK